jgi:hypothetical protein
MAQEEELDWRKKKPTRKELVGAMMHIYIK